MLDTIVIYIYISISSARKRVCGCRDFFHEVSRSQTLRQRSLEGSWTLKPCTPEFCTSAAPSICPLLVERFRLSSGFGTLLQRKLSGIARRLGVADRKEGVSIRNFKRSHREYASHLQWPTGLV